MQIRKKQVPLEDQTSEEFLARGYKACVELGWKIKFISDTGLVAITDWSLGSWGQTITITLDQQDATIKSDGTSLFDGGTNRQNVADLIERIGELKVQMSSEELHEEIKKLREQKVLPEEDTLNPESTASKEQKKWWTILIPSKTHLVVPVLIDVNIILFVLMCIFSGSFGTVFLPESDVLVQWGGNYKPLTLEGEWWRLFTCMFAHIGVIHLVMNMYALLYVGLFLEPLLGKWRFAIAYVSTGIFASLTSLWWHDNTVSAGASGAIFGMYGVFLALLLTNLIEKSARNSMLASITIFIGYNLVFGLKAGVDNAAHIGGLLSGFVIGFLLYADMTKLVSRVSKALVILLIFVSPIITAFVMFPKIENPIADYTKIVTKFQEYETKGLDVYNNKDTDADAGQVKYLMALLDHGVPNWQRGMDELKKLDSINNLPKELVPYKQSLQEYAKLRYKQAVMYKEHISGERIYTDSAFSKIQEEIDAILERMK